MQTIFRLPWSTEPSSDEALAEKMYLHKQSRPKPRVEIPLLNTIKRKRVDSADASPKNAAHVKKLKGDRDGAVQPASVPAKGVDAVSDFRPHVFSASNDKPSKQESVGGNVSTFQVLKEQAPSTPGVTTPSVPSSVAPTPTTAEMDAASGLDSFAITQTTMADPDSNLDKLRAIIEAHINLEILHKHNELRLIDQELAKCQVSLEQLRRCELMPYPGSTGPSADVTKGTGKSLKAPAGYTEPQYPAPWGVTDGPYARHYATWLLPDPAFDPWRVSNGGHVGTPMTTRGNRANHRTSPFDFHVPQQSVRISRTSTGNRADPGTPSGRDPMIMKRQQDGEWVRLRCSVCHRSNFNNIQGFLNHCRIAHHQDYKSHEAAAIACGEVVQVDEAEMAAAEPAAPKPIAPAPTPRAMTMPLPTPAPRSAAQDFFPVTTPVEQPHVNPIILQNPAHKPLERVVDLTSTGSPKPAIARSSMKNGTKGQSAPHLSALMQRRGIPTEGMSTFMLDAKKKVDLSAYDVHSDSEHDHVDGKSKKSKQKKPKSNVQRSQSTPGAARPASSKALGRQAPTFQVMPPPPATGIGFHPSVFQHVIDTPTEEMELDMELSPGTAPGLVSDHEDDFDDDDRSANGSHHHHDNMEDVEIRDASDGERDDRKPSSCEGQVCSRQAGAGIC